MSDKEKDREHRSAAEEKVKVDGKLRRDADESHDADDSGKKKKKKGDTLVYMTEEEIKAQKLREIELMRKAAAARPPKSKRAVKRENFLYHYKFHLIAGIIGVVLIVFFVRDVFFQTKADMTVVLVSGGYMMPESVEALQAELEKYAGDINGDGKVLVSIDSITLPAFSDEEETGEGEQSEGELMTDMASSDPQADYASAMKLMAVLASNTDPIYVMDQAGYDYIMRSNGEDDAYQPGDIFVVLEPDLPGAQSEALPIPGTDIETGDYSFQFEDMSIYVRNYNGKKEKEQQYFDDGLAMVERVAAGTVPEGNGEQ